MKFRDFELDFDIMNADHAAIYENAKDTVLEKVNAKRIADESLSDMIRRQCNIIYEFFDTVVGVDFRKQLFPDGDNVKTCLSAYIDFMEAIDRENKEFAGMVNEITARKAAKNADQAKNTAANTEVNGKTAWRKA